MRKTEGNKHKNAQEVILVWEATFQLWTMTYLTHTLSLMLNSLWSRSRWQLRQTSCLDHLNHLWVEKLSACKAYLPGFMFKQRHIMYLTVMKLSPILSSCKTVLKDRQAEATLPWKSTRGGQGRFVATRFPRRRRKNIEEMEDKRADV